MPPLAIFMLLVEIPQEMPVLLAANLLLRDLFGLEIVTLKQQYYLILNKGLLIYGGFCIIET